MSEAYRVTRYHHVTPAKHRRLLLDNLVPLLDKFAEVKLLHEDIEDIMMSKDARSLNITDFDAYESQILTIQSITKGDWLIEYKDENNPIYLYKIERYQFEPRIHLHIKHFARIEHIFKIQSTIIPVEALKLIADAGHLATLPLSISNMLEKYEALAHARNLKKQQQELQNEEDIRQELKKYRLSASTSIIRPRNKPKNGPVIIRRAVSKVIKPEKHAVPKEYQHLIRPGEYLSQTVIAKRIKKFQKRK